MKKIIIIDDNPTDRLILRGLLEDGGYEVLSEGSNGEDAVGLCRKTSPDAIIMDIRMPSKDGITAACEITALPAAIPIVLVTGSQDMASVKRAADAGAMAYLTKPVNEEELFAAIELAIARQGEFERLKKENADLKTAIEARKFIEKAKGLIMAKEGITENEAFGRIRKISMDKRKTMKEIAEVIIMTLEKREPLRATHASRPPISKAEGSPPSQNKI